MSRVASGGRSVVYRAIYTKDVKGEMVMFHEIQWFPMVGS